MRTLKQLHEAVDDFYHYDDTYEAYKGRKKVTLLPDEVALLVADIEKTTRGAREYAATHPGKQFTKRRRNKPTF